MGPINVASSPLDIESIVQVDVLLAKKRILFADDVLKERRSLFSSRVKSSESVLMLLK